MAHSTLRTPITYVAFSGKKGSGKTTACDKMIAALHDTQPHLEIVVSPFAGPLKRLLMFMFPAICVADDPTLDKDTSKAQLLPLHYDTDVFDMDKAFATMLQHTDATPGESAQKVADLMCVPFAIFTSRFLEAIDVFERLRSAATTPYTVGVALQVLGTECIREHVGDSFWIDVQRAIVEPCLARGNCLVICPDCRYENELKFVLGLGSSAKIIRVVRSGTGDDGTGRNSQHASETALDNVDFNVVLENKGTLDDMAAKIHAWVDEWF